MKYLKRFLHLLLFPCITTPLFAMVTSVKQEPGFWVKTSDNRTKFTFFGYPDKTSRDHKKLAFVDVIKRQLNDTALCITTIPLEEFVRGITGTGKTTTFEYLKPFSNHTDIFSFTMNDDAEEQHVTIMHNGQINKIVSCSTFIQFLNNPFIDPRNFPIILKQQWPSLGVWWRVKDHGDSFFSFSHNQRLCFTREKSILSMLNRLVGYQDDVVIHEYNLEDNEYDLENSLLTEYTESTETTKESRQELLASLKDIVHIFSNDGIEVPWYCTAEYGPFIFKKDKKSPMLQVSHNGKIVREYNIHSLEIRNFLVFLQKPYGDLLPKKIQRRNSL